MADKLTDKDHYFKLHHFSKPTWCNYCGDFIWGLGRQGFKCKLCKYAGHKRCYRKAPNNCEQRRRMKGLESAKIVSQRVDDDDDDDEVGSLIDEDGRRVSFTVPSEFQLSQTEFVNLMENRSLQQFIPMYRLLLKHGLTNVMTISAEEEDAWKSLDLPKALWTAVRDWANGKSAAQLQNETTPDAMKLSKEEIEKLQNIWHEYIGPHETASANFAMFAKFYDAVVASGENKMPIPSSAEQMQRLYNSMDYNGDGKIQFEEYVMFSTILKNPSATEMIKTMFCLYDENGDGFLTRKELRKAMFQAKGLTLASEKGMEQLEIVESLVDQIFNKAAGPKAEHLTVQDVCQTAAKDPTFLDLFVHL